MMENYIKYIGINKVFIDRNLDKDVYKSTLKNETITLVSTLGAITLIVLQVLKLYPMDGTNIFIHLLSLGTIVLLIALFMYSISGYETITIYKETLVIENKCLGIGRTREYKLSKIEDIRININHDPRGKEMENGKISLFGINQGYIIFKYGLKHIHIGYIYNPELAIEVINLVKEKQHGLVKEI